jgi:hypothetical protein
MAARYGLVALAFAAFFAAFFSPALVGGNLLTVAGDGSAIALPMYLVPHGLWEPGIMLGYPWSSNFNGTWDPLMLLRLVPHSFNAYMLAAYVIAATGAFAIVDVLTGSMIGGAVAGLSYALGGFMIGHLGHYDIVHPAAWTPWVLLAFVALRRRTDWLPVIGGALAIGLCALAGQPQVLVYTLLLAFAYAVTVGAGEPDRGRYAARTAATFGLGIALAGIVLAPGALLVLSSFRAQPSLDYFLGFSIPPWQLPLRLLFPYFAGESHQPLYPLSTIPIGSDAEFSGYAGIVTLVLAAVALIVRRGDRTVRFFALAALVALALSTGNGLHVDALTFRIPGFNLFRAQGRNMLEFTLLAAVLGGFGAADIARGRVSARALTTAVVAVGVALAAAAGEALLSGAREGAANDPLRNPALFVPLLVFVLAVVALAALRRRPSSRVAAVALVACAIVDLSSFAWFQYWRTPVNEAQLQPPAQVAALRAELARTHQRVFSVAGSETLGVGIPPNLSLVWGIPSAGGVVQLLLTAPGIFLQLFPQGTMAPSLLLDGTDRSLDLAAIRYVIIPAPQAAAFLAARPGWRLAGTGAIGAVLENPRAEPRARIVHRVVVVAPDAALAAIRSGSVDTHAVALVQGGDPLETAADPSDAATIVALAPDAMRVRVRCRTACFLTTSDTYNGMWHAAIDGARVPLRLTDYALRGVAVPAGTHEVAFTYRPWILMLGGAVTIAAGCVLLALAVISFRSASSRARGTASSLSR